MTLALRLDLILLLVSALGVGFLLGYFESAWNFRPGSMFLVADRTQAGGGR